MKPELKELIDISRFYGRDKNYVIAGGGRSEERRVGKESRFRWSQYQKKKNKNKSIPLDEIEQRHNTMI